MNKHKFIQYLRKPGELDKRIIGELEEIIDQFPYFHSARTLLAKASKIKKTRNAQRNIRLAAAYATDRALLKRYLNGELVFLKPLNVHESHEADLERDPSARLQERKTESIQNKLKKATPPTKVSSQKTNTVGLPQKPNSLDRLIQELYGDMEELKRNRAKFKEYEEKLEEDEAVSKALKKAKKSTPTKKKTNPELEEKKTAPTAKKAQKSTTKNKAPEAKKTSGTTKKTAGNKSSDNKGTEEKKDEKGVPKKSEQSVIISEFIRKNPSISPAKNKKEKNDSDLSNESTELYLEDIATEYLAEIYLKQGKINRAVEIYKALMLKFPEKKSYFANLIEKIK